MSVFRSAHHKSGQWSPSPADRNFMPETAPAFRFVSHAEPAAKRRNTLAAPISRYNAPRGDQLVPGRYCAVRAILAILFLCTAFACGAASGPNPRPRPSRAARRWSQPPIARAAIPPIPPKPFAGGKRIDTPFGGDLFAQSHAGSRYRHRGMERRRFLPRAALRRGADGSRYYPAFPYPNFTKLIRDDVLAIRAYLATLAPFSNTPPPSELLWPLNYRVLMRGWNWLFFQPGIFQPEPAEKHRNGIAAAIWSKVPRIAAHAIRPKTFSAPTSATGSMAAALVQGWFAPRLDGAARSGLKSWSADDIVEYLAERPQRPQPCRRADGRSRRQFDLEDERRAMFAPSRSI